MRFVRLSTSIKSKRRKGVIEPRGKNIHHRGSSGHSFPVEVAVKGDLVWVSYGGTFLFSFDTSSRWLLGWLRLGPTRGR